MITTYLYQLTNLVMLEFNKYYGKMLRSAINPRMLKLLSYTKKFYCFYDFPGRCVNFATTNISLKNFDDG